MESWAEELNSSLDKLVDSTEEIKRLHKLYFEDITLNDWKNTHDEHDGMADEAYEFFHDNFFGNTIRGLFNGGSNLANDVKRIINTATHPSKWSSVLNSFFNTLGYIASPSNWFNIGTSLIAGLMLTVKNEGLGYALGNSLFFIGEEIATDGVISELKLGDSGGDAVRIVERGDDAIDTVNSIKRIDRVESTVKQVDSKTIEVTAKDGTKYQYNGRIQNKRYVGKVNPKTGVEYDINGFPIFESKVTYQLPKSDYHSGRAEPFPLLNEKLYLDIENGAIDNPFPEGVDYTCLKEGVMPQYYNEELGKSINYYSWHHNQEPGVMELVEYKVHKDSKHTGGFAI